MANKKIVEWFDNLESVLEAEARLSGLLDHASTIGQAREFLVARVLRTILPAGVDIGNGRIIDSQGGCSKQIDIIVYDPRFPMMKVDGGGLYLVEGTLATIEVKSTIDSSELKRGLDNCRSVLDLRIDGEYPEEAAARINYYETKLKISHEDAKQKFSYMIRPATYIFGFTSKLSFQTFQSCVTEWWGATNCAYSEHFPLFPRVIATGNAVGFVNDGRISLKTDIGKQHVMALFPTSFRFRWFAIHLMDAVNQRLGLRNWGERFEYRISDYFPWDEYLHQIKSVETTFIGRDKLVLSQATNSRQ